MEPAHPSPPPETVRPPQQARSRRTLERLEKAALELVARDGPDSVTVAQVVARARSSVGSFYARFQGKDELFVHLAEGLRRQALERWRALDVTSAPDPVAATVDFLVEDEVEGGGRRRALLAQGDSGTEGGEFSGVVAGDLHRALAERGADAPSLEAVTLAVRVVRASLAAMVAASPAGTATSPAADGGERVDPAMLRRVLEEVARVVLNGGGVESRQEADEVPTPVPDEFREPVEEEGHEEEAEEPAVPDPAVPEPAEAEPVVPAPAEPAPAASEPETAAEGEAPALLDSADPPDLPEAPLEDESPPVDPFDVWG